MNNQPAEKSEMRDPDTLQVHSIFPTMQGEGPFVGQPCIFVRLAGCNLQCPMCDTDYTSVRRDMTVLEIAREIASYTTYPLVVITGGEPFRQDLGGLVGYLQSIGKKVQIETNGTLYGDFLEHPQPDLTIVCSPKAGSINKKLAPHIAALKYVVCHDSVDQEDGLPLLALAHSASPKVARPPKGFTGPVYVQPADSDNDRENQKHLKVAIASCMSHGYTLCLQTHKIIGMD
jgi:organic radical activating enzyme